MKTYLITEDQALKELNDHYSELREEVQNGFIDDYNMSDFRIAKAKT